MRERLRGLPLRDIALLAVAIALITTFNLLGAHNGEEQAQSLDSYSSYDAASGGYRAWYELLQREKIGVERFEQRPAFLDRKLDTLVWSEPIEFDPRQTSNTKADIRALQDWVKAGGRFVYLGHDENAAKQGVLKLPRTKALKNAKDDGKNLTIAAELSSEGVGRVAFDTNLRWKAPKRATVLVADAAGPLALSYSYGKGQVVAVLDETAFENARIARADNARLAYVLANPRRAGALVAFDEAAHGYLVPETWWQIMPRPLLIALAIAVVALVVAFTGAAIRLGPPLTPPARTDATSAEFIDSLAALFERGRAATKALEEVARSTTRIVAVALGVPDDAPPASIAKRIEAPDLRDAYLELVAAADAPKVEESRLVGLVACAQRLRKGFATHARPRY
jgi:flagellar basal body-associated protein FliL